MCEETGGFKNWMTRVMHNWLMNQDEGHYQLLVSTISLAKDKDEAAAMLKSTFLGSDFQDALVESRSVHGDLLLNALQEVDWNDLIETNWHIKEDHNV